MKRTLGLAVVSLLVFFFSLDASFAGSPATPHTLRIDYYHTGNSHEEWFSLDRVVLEPASGKLLYSRGFNSVFGEWKTTDEALHGNRTFSESLRFPNPEAVVEVSLKERGDSASPSWKEVWKTVVDPKSESVDRSRPPSPGALLELQKMGNPANKVDLLVLGDGYTAAER